MNSVSPIGHSSNLFSKGETQFTLIQLKRAEDVEYASCFGGNTPVHKWSYLLLKFRLVNFFRRLSFKKVQSFHT